MTQTIIHGYEAMLAHARTQVRTIPADEAVKLLGQDNVVFVDVRDPRELEREGQIPGAFHCPRGMLEFWIDPASPYHKTVFAQDKQFIFFCAGGWRSLLSAEVAQGMGLKSVADIGGGFKGWREAGGLVEFTKKDKA